MLPILNRALGRMLVIVLCAVFVRNSAAQTQLVSKDYFPAELEFKELQKVSSEKSGEGRASLADRKEASVFAEVGFLHYVTRVYVTDAGSDLSIEVLTARDEKAAYSLLTLFRGSKINAGPPGDAFAAIDNGLIFAKGPFWVRIRGTSPADLYRRIAFSVSNRIGERNRAIPLLVTRLPQNGMEPESVRYFLGPISLESFGTDILGSHTVFGPEVEVAQAQYSHGAATGVLSLINFPTSEAAETYFDKVSVPEASAGAQGAIRRYAKKVGPIVGVLQGGFDPVAADEILRSLKYTYSIRWIYDKNNRNAATLWGVPVGILGTVVRSLMLTALLCGLSLLLGVGLAMFRVFLREYAPNNFLDRPERTEMIRLRLNDVPIPPASSSSKTGVNHNS